MALSFSRKIIEIGNDALLMHFLFCSKSGRPGWWLVLQNEDLSNRDFSGWTFVRTKFDGSKISNANFSRAYFLCCSFFGANLHECNFQDAHISSITKLGRQLPFGNLMIAANLSKCNFQSADLTDVYLAGSDATGTNFRKAILRRAKFGLSSEDASQLVVDIESKLGQTESIFDLEDYASEILSGRDFTSETAAFEYLSQKLDESWGLFYSTLTPSSPIIETVSFISTELMSYLKSHPNELFNIRPRQFEELIAEILRSFGWEIKLTSSTKDGGYDIYGVVKDVSGLRTHWIIECKKYAADNKVGIDVVRQLYGVKSDRKVANALLATTSYFTKGAQEFKASRYDLELRDYNGVIDWVQSYKGDSL